MRLVPEVDMHNSEANVQDFDGNNPGGGRGGGGAVRIPAEALQSVNGCSDISTMPTFSLCPSGFFHLITCFTLSRLQTFLTMLLQYLLFAKFPLPLSLAPLMGFLELFSNFTEFLFSSANFILESFRVFPN